MPVYLDDVKGAFIDKILETKLRKYCRILFEYDQSVKEKIKVCYYRAGDCKKTDLIEQRMAIFKDTVYKFMEDYLERVRLDEIDAKKK